MILTNGEPDKAQVHHLPALTADERARLHGRVRCRPTAAVTAGTSVRLRFAFCLGQQGLAAGGALRATNCD